MFHGYGAEGKHRTEQVEEAYRRRARAAGDPEDWESIERRIVERDFPNPCGRIATREEVAALVCFLCGDRAGFINAQNTRIDGGALRVALWSQRRSRKSW
jgi:3-oxoacyl-[acyl-carrier protein] reductase